MSAPARSKAVLEEAGEHAAEPWIRLGRYVRDAGGRVLLRAKNAADTRRIVACVNAFRGVPTETVEQWTIQVSGGAGAGPDPDLASIPTEAIRAVEELLGSEERRVGERRRGDRRRAARTASEGETR